jgi:hypothetical protein
MRKRARGRVAVSHLVQEGHGAIAATVPVPGVPQPAAHRGSDYAFTSRGLHSLKGVPEEWELLAVS